MNRERAKELLPIVQAFADGEMVQFRWSEVPWTDMKEHIDFCNSNIDVCEYRIKPKPREFEIMVMGDGLICDATDSGGNFGEVIKVIEVIE